jgi:hypothetical protein
MTQSSLDKMYFRMVDLFEYSEDKERRKAVGVVVCDHIARVVALKPTHRIPGYGLIVLADAYERMVLVVLDSLEVVDEGLSDGRAEFDYP